MGERVDREDWVETTLGEICVIKDGMRVPVNQRTRDTRVEGKSGGDLFRYFGATGQVGWIDDFLFEGTHVLLGEDGAPFYDIYKSKAYVVSGKYWVNNHAHVLQALIESHLLCHYLNQVDYHGYVTGTTRLKLNQSAMRCIPVQVPPLVEQRAIVAKIEALFSELDKGAEQLESLRGQLKRYRQSVLKAAFEGRLTAEWRAERARPFIQNSEQLKVAETPETYGTKKHPPLTEEELAELPELPEGWRWVRLGSISHLIGGVTKGRKLGDRAVIELPYLRVANVQDGYLDLSEMKTILLPVEEKAKYLLEVGDVLYIEGGDKDKLGRGTVWRGEIRECIHQNHVFRARPYDSVFPAFLGAFSQTQTARNYFFRHAKQTVNLASINMTLLSCLPVPMPPLPEQRQIVAEIEARFSALDQLEQTVEAGLKQAEALRQSILKKAFEGRLLSASERAAVRADPAYEPAARLLERIRERPR